MRELKFRAWDKGKKKFIERFDISCEGVVWTQAMNCDPEYPNAILEQCTGLKDTNGVDIYEGDILEDGSGDPTEYWTVKFEDGKFIGSTQGVDEDILELTDLEVIGNIHENPDIGETKMRADELVTVVCPMCGETMEIPKEEEDDAECWLCGTLCKEEE